MTTNVLQSELAPAIREVLDALRRRIRWYVWLEGLGWAVAWLGAAFWASLALDRFLELLPVTRALLLGFVGLVTLWGLYRKILRRAFVPLGDPSMALLLERYFPQFGDSLLCAVELAENGTMADGLSQELLARTFRKAAGPLGEVHLPKVFNPRPLRTSLGAAAVLFASVVLFGLLRSETMGIWARRSLLFADEPWPHTTRLLVEGFESGSVKILRGTDHTVVALADREMPDVPERVYVEFLDGGVRKSKPMRHQHDSGEGRGFRVQGSGFREEGARDWGLGTRDGESGEGETGHSSSPAPSPQPLAPSPRYERFSYAFTSVMNPITFDVVGGDDAVRGLRIEVVDSPAIVTMEIDCEYPPYTGRPAKSFPVTGVMQFPWGSRLTVRATSNKDLVLVTVELERGTGGESSPHPSSVVTLRPAADNPRSLRHAIPSLTKETTLLFTLHDTDGIRSREPVQLTLAAVEDERPRLSARLQGIGTAGAVIAPQAMLPVAGQVTDDYGIARIWFEHVVDQNAPGTREIATLPGNATEFVLEPSKTVFDAANLGLKPGQKLGICLKAADRFNMGSGPNVGSSDRWVLEVVSPQQLQIMLKARQLVLRQQFEETVKKVEYTRNLLAAIDFSPPPKPETAKKSRVEKLESGKAESSTLNSQLSTLDSRKRPRSGWGSGPWTCGRPPRTASPTPTRSSAWPRHSAKSARS